jgi:alpha-amylase
MLAYAFILTHEGYPCVFWQDYYNWGLGQPGSVSGIAELISVHEDYAGGGTSVLHIADDLYIMQRTGLGSQKGLVFILNTSRKWSGTWVQTQWQHTRLVPVAWRGADDLGVPMEKQTEATGWADFWAPPRGYAVYVPE